MKKITRSDIEIGMTVDVSSSGDFYRGRVKEIISKTTGKNGVKVLLTNGIEGNVVEIIQRDEIERGRNIMFNKYFSSREVYIVWQKKPSQPYIIDSKFGTVAFIFLTKEDVDDYINKKELGMTNFISNTLSNRKLISEHLEKFDIDNLVLSNKVRVANNKFASMQREFNSLSKVNTNRKR